MIEPVVATALDEAVRVRSEHALELLERLVAEPSELGAEAGAIAIVRDELDAIGFDTAVLPIPVAIADDPAAGVPVIPYDGVRGPLVARLPAARPRPAARSLLFNGHLDVVPPGSTREWTTDPYRARRDDGWMVGRGAADMKGGVIMALLSARAFLDVLGPQMGAELAFVAAIEEECTGNGTLASVRAGVLADAVVLTESTDLDLLTAGLGVLWMTVDIRTAGGHAETAGSVPSALDLAAGLLPALRALAPDPQGATRYRVNIGRLASGDWTSSVPADARIDVRVGFPADWAPAEAERWVRERIEAAVEALPGLRADQVSIAASGMRAAGYALPADSELIAALRDAHLDAHGEIPGITATEATTDARFYVNEADVPALCFGPRARAMHAADESVELDSIVQGARTLVRFMAGWLAPDPLPAAAPSSTKKEA